MKSYVQEGIYVECLMKLTMYFLGEKPWFKDVIPEKAKNQRILNNSNSSRLFACLSLNNYVVINVSNVR